MEDNYFPIFIVTKDDDDGETTVIIFMFLALPPAEKSDITSHSRIVRVFNNRGK